MWDIKPSELGKKAGEAKDIIRIFAKISMQRALIRRVVRFIILLERVKKFNRIICVQCMVQPNLCEIPYDNWFFNGEHHEETGSSN
jgi:hypothetical protein